MTRLTLRFLAASLLPLVLLLLAACQPVLVREPVGAAVREDLAPSFDGTWQSDDGRYVFYVKGGTDGVLRVSGLAWKNDRFAVEETTCVITRAGDWMYLNVPLANDSAGNRQWMFAPFVLSKGDNLLTAFFPSGNYFRDAIERGLLKGHYDSAGFGYTVVERADTTFFARHGSEIATSGEPLILRRTRPGTNSEAWPLDK